MKLQRLRSPCWRRATTALAAMSTLAADSVKIAVIDPLSGRLPTLARPWCVIHSNR